MGQMLSALLHLQSIERRIVTVRSRLRSREEGEAIQQRRIAQTRGDWEALHEQSLQRRKEADSLDLDLKEREEKVKSLRAALNTAKTNKEYAAILTQLNTMKADNAKLEEDALKALQEVDTIKVDADEIQAKIDAEEQLHEELVASNKEEIRKLSAMMEELTIQRKEAAAEVPRSELALFERISRKVDGDAMAPVEIHGKKPPHDYVCGGCFMSLNAEHTNALRTRDEIRTCDSCGRILYLEEQASANHSERS